MSIQNKPENSLNIKNKKHISDEGKHWPQVFAIFIVALGTFTNGLMLTWSSPFALVITKDKENYHITEEDASYFIIFQPLGMIFASVLCLAVPHLITWIITILARSKWEFYAARFIAGMSEAMLFCSIPPYIGEITTPTVRGYWGNFPTFVIHTGSLSITLLGSFLDVRTTAYICITIPLIFIMAVSTILPESPYYLIEEHKYEEAKQSIKWLKRKVDIEEDFLSMKADVERQMSERGQWKDLLIITSNRNALRAGAFLRFSQQFCGIAVFGTFTQTIFRKAGGDLSPQIEEIQQKLKE